MQIRKKPKGRGNVLVKVSLVLICAIMGFATLFDSSNVGMGSVISAPAKRETISYTATDKESSRTESKRKIRQISIIGERNSGTRWTFG